MACHGLRFSDFDALLRLSRSPNQQLRMTDLARQTDMSTSGVTRLADRLERAGLADRRLDQDDRRSWVLALSEPGRATLAHDIAELTATIEEWLIAPLGPDLTRFEDTLRILRDHIRPEATADSQHTD